ncbi:MAG: alpha/beta hydrolase [Gammaproteobacteria bacterium]
MNPIVLLLLAAAGYLALGYSMQRAVMFPNPPVPLDDIAAEIPGLEKIWLEQPDGRVEAWFLPPYKDTDDPTAVLLFTHGNGELIDYWAEAFDVVRSWNVAVLLVEYPGYGRSSGKPSEQSITETMVAAYDRVAERLDVDASRVVAYGRSIGAGAACALASHRDVAALILESPFTSVRPLAWRAGLPGFLVRDPFDNLSVVERFEGPVLIMHGERDGIVPIKHSETLHEAAPDSVFKRYACGHNDCPRPWRDIHGFLEDQSIL